MKIIPLSSMTCLLVSLIAVGCAGRNFTRPATSNFELGKTTMREITNQFGKPLNKAEVYENGVKAMVIDYGFMTMDWGSLKPMRLQKFFFCQDKLVGYQFSSSFKSDSTDFDGTKVSQIQTNVSTRAEVEKLLGPAGGRCIHPLVAQEDEAGIVYLYSQTRGVPFGVKTYTKSLLVTFNRQDIVTHVKYTEAGEK
jgi:hypothetical protein